MRNSKVQLVLAAMLILISCKKDNSAANSNNSSLPRTYTEDIRSSVIGNAYAVFDITYDANNRITALTATPSPPVYNFVYTYPAAGTVTLDFYQGGILNIHEILWLNASSNLDSTYQFDNTGDTTTEKYFYNGSSQLIKENSYIYSSSETTLDNITAYTYDNLGNVASANDYHGTSTSYTYYTDLPYTLTLSQSFTPRPLYFVKTAVTNYSGTEVTTNHYYTFDNSNRLIKDSASIVEYDAITIKSYSY